MYEWTDEELQKWRKAAKIAAEVLDYGKGLIKNGSSFLDVSDKIDKKIFDLGGKPAWATQLSFDSVAAHQCAEPEDETVFDNNVVKLDVGVHVDGFIGDNAVTVDLSKKYSDLVKASRDALNQVEKILQIGVTLDEIGKTVQETITGYGFSPIRNLSGHTMSRYDIHDRPSIPNIATGDDTELEKGQIVAIEPFATTGVGTIYDSEKCNLFSLGEKKPIRSPFAREILQHIDTNYGVFPFTTRWLVSKFGKGKTSLALRELTRLKILGRHPPLVETAKGIVSQAEHTFLIGDKVERLTRF